MYYILITGACNCPETQCLHDAHRHLQLMEEQVTGKNKFSLFVCSFFCFVFLLLFFVWLFVVVVLLFFNLVGHNREEANYISTSNTNS